MKNYKRIFVIVIDSLGIGSMNDSEKYGDFGVNTLGHIAEFTGTLKIPNMQHLGIANLCSLKNINPVEKPAGYYAEMNEVLSPLFTFATISATIADNFHIPMPQNTIGFSILNQIE